MHTGSSGLAMHNVCEAADSTSYHAIRHCSSLAHAGAHEGPPLTLVMPLVTEPHTILGGVSLPAGLGSLSS